MDCVRRDGAIRDGRRIAQHGSYAVALMSCYRRGTMQPRRTVATPADERLLLMQVERDGAWHDLLIVRESRVVHLCARLAPRRVRVVEVREAPTRVLATR